MRRFVRPAVTLVQTGDSSDWSPNQFRIESFTNSRTMIDVAFASGSNPLQLDRVCK
jgi:hypothetical protein